MPRGDVRRPQDQRLGLAPDVELVDDEDFGVVHVRRTLTYAGGEHHFGPPKSDAGSRDLNAPAFVVRALRRHRAAQGERLLELGKRPGPGDLVVDDGIGGPWLPASFSTGWRRYAKAHGFEGVTFHGLRHGAATLLLAAGVPDAVAIGIMGHADTAILRRYQDVVSHLRRDAATRMDARDASGFEPETLSRAGAQVGDRGEAAAWDVVVGESEPVIWQSADRSSSLAVSIRSRRVGRGAPACRG